MASKRKKKAEREITLKQMRGVQNIVSGEYPSKAKALQAAGYSAKSGNSMNPKRFLQQDGVKKYIRSLNKESRKIFGKSIEKKVVEIYVAGMGATKLFGKDAIEHPDWVARKAFADNMASMLGMKGETAPQKGNQYNFFMFNQTERDEFNSAFGDFVKGYFKK